MTTNPRAVRALLLIASCWFLFVVNPSAVLGQRYQVHTYAEEDGLPAPSILDITQDPTGCIWVATRAGAACYDGSNWRQFGFDDGLESVDLKHIAIDDAGVPWVATKGSPVRLSKFDGERWLPVTHDKFETRPEAVTEMVLAGSGDTLRVLFGTDRGGLLLWEAKSLEWTRFAPLVPGSRVDAIVRANDRFLIASAGRLFELGDVPRELPTPLEDLRGLCWDERSDQLFFIGPNKVVVQRSGEQPRLWASFEVEFPLGHGPGFVATLGPQNALYFGNTGALYSLPEAGVLSYLNPSSGLIGSGTTTLHRDREGNLWIGCTRGLSKLVSRRFANYDRTHGLFQSEVTAVLESQAGTMVLGHPDGLTFLEETPRHLPFGSGKGDARVLDMEEAPDGTLWIAASWAGLIELRTDGKLVVHGAEAGLSIPVTSVLTGPNGLEWVATGSGMYARTEHGFDVLPELSPGDSSGFGFRDLTRGADGQIFCGTGLRGVLSWGEGRSPTLIGPKSGPVGSSTYTVHLNAEGVHWVGTTVGLKVLEDGFLKVCTEPAISRPVYFIEAGANGTTWFGTNSGVYHWNGDRLRHFAVEHGLAGSETNRAAGLLDSRGRFWIGTNRGVSIYNEACDAPRPHLPTVELLACDTPRSSDQSSNDESDLAHTQNRLTFRYRAIAFTDESRVRFQTCLGGFEGDWSEPHLNPLRQTTYGSLPPGDYTFKVRAIDVEGQVSETARWDTVHIREPYWNQNWFRAIAVLVTLGVLTAASVLFTQHRNASRLEREVALRTRELSEAQAATEGERARLAITLANIADGVATICLDGKVLLWNHAAHRITGWSSEEVIGRPLTDFLGVGALDPMLGGRSSRAVTMRTGENRQLDIASVETAPVAGISAGRVVVFRDVTQKLALDRELVREDKLEALGLLAGGIAHDFNNLLTVIIGNLSLPLPSSLSTGDFANSIHDANSAANRARLLTLQLLTFSKGGEPVRHTASVADLLDETSSFIFSGANVLCDIQTASDLRLVEVDAGQMGQVFHNLMLNAREAMPEGGTLRIKAGNLREVPAFLTAGDYILIEFADEGVGVSPDDLKHIFDPYFSTKSRGSGLGLAIAYSVVQRHGGHVTVDSIVGHGTIFRIYLKASGTQLPDRSDPKVVSPPKRHARILVMDDEAAILRVVTSMLEKAGYEAAQAKDGQDAIAQYEQALRAGRRFDAVIMDLTIPGGMGGKDAIRELRRLDPTVCAIVASGYSNDPVMARAEDFGFCSEISKPFSAEQLVGTIERVLERRERQRISEANTST